MKKQEKKRILNIFAITLILVAFLFVFMLQIRESVVTFRSYENTSQIPLATGTFTLNGYEGNYETPALGSISCSGNPGSYYCYSQAGLGGNPEKDVSFSNSISDGNTLILYSSASSDDTMIENYLEAEITLPAGKITGSYDGSATFSSSKASTWGSLIVFEVYNKTYSKIIPPHSTSYSFSDNFEFVLDTEKSVNFKIITKTGQPIGASSQGELIVNFEPTQTIIGGNQTNECSVNSDCSTGCGDLLPYCIDNECFCEDNGNIVNPPTERNNSWILYAIGVVVLMIIITLVFKKRGKKR